MAIAGSALTHAALFGALTFAEANYPVAGDNGLKIFWLDLSKSLPDPGTPSQPDEPPDSETSDTFEPQESTIAFNKSFAAVSTHQQMAANNGSLSATPSEQLPPESASPINLKDKQPGKISASHGISVAPKARVELKEQPHAVDVRQRHVIVPEIQQNSSNQICIEARKKAADPKPSERRDPPIPQASVGASNTSGGVEADRALTPPISTEKKSGYKFSTVPEKENHLPKTVSVTRRENVQAVGVQQRQNHAPEIQEQRREIDQTVKPSRKSDVASTRPSVKSYEDRGPHAAPHLQTSSKPALNAPYSTARSGDAEIPSKRTVNTNEKGESTSLFKSTAENANGVVPSIRGDLKMIISGNSGANLRVIFRPYPSARRAKAQTRAEALRQKTVVPVMLRPSAGVLEAVIETAEEGIYLFTITPDGSGIATGAFTFRIFEGSARERIVKLGSRRTSGETTLVKILMPEAIIWDDNAAFTGSIEDSESTTKFNSVTGLCWKEYN